MLVARRTRGPTKKKKLSGLRKKKKLYWLTISLVFWQELTSLLVKIFEEVEKIIAINNQAMQPLIFRPLMQTQLILPTILVIAKIDF